MEELTTGAEYPSIELGGQSYQVKFTRGLMYRMDKLGLSFDAKFTKEGELIRTTMPYHNIIDVLHMAIGFKGTQEELSEFVYDRRDEIMVLMVGAWGKVALPSINARLSVQSAAKANAETNTAQPTVQ